MTLRLLAALLCLAALDARAATWDSDEVPLGDVFVSRAGPDGGESSFSPRTRLGVLLTSYHKLTLFEAYRLLALGPEVIEAEDRTEETASDDRDSAIPAWTDARGTVTDAAPRRTLGLYRRYGPGMFGEYVNCTPGAFRLAAETLADLQRSKVARADLRAWVKAQDAVFEFCTYVPPAPGGAKPAVDAEDDDSAGPAPAVPPKLPGSAPAHLRQLREYQIAAAWFYAGQHARAASAFQAIARTPGHPMRTWAALAALRARLREGSLDQTFMKEYLATQDLAPAERKPRLRAAVLAERDHKRKALAEIERGVEEILGKADLAPIHAATRTLREQAIMMLYPARGVALITERLASPEANPYTHGTLWQWQQLWDQVGGGPQPELEALRARVPFLDWILTVQHCTDNPASPNVGDCAAEHRHALEVWAGKKDAAWLVAVLMTARTVGPDDEQALAAALAVPSTAPEALTLRFHAARALLAAGRRAEALKIADEVLGQPDELGRSASSLFQQIRLSAAARLADLGPLLLRDSGRSYEVKVSLGADGDELLNRVLASEDLLALADAPATPDALRTQLRVAAWFRADVAGRDEVAERAARQVQELQDAPELANAARAYLSVPRVAWARRSIMAVVGLRLHVSPVVGWRWDGRDAVGEVRAEFKPFQNWCTFDPARFAPQRQIERMLPVPAITPAKGAADEQARLREAGPSSTYMARVVLAAVDRWTDKQLAVDVLRAVRVMLQDESCPSPEAARLRQEIERKLSDLKPTETE